MSTAQGPQRHAGGILAAPCASASVSAGCSATRASASSPALHQPLASTGVAPICRQAQKLTIHSGLFQPRRKTRAPRPTSRATSSRAFAPMACRSTSKVTTRSPCTMCGRAPQRSANASRCSTRRGRSVYIRKGTPPSTSTAMRSPQRAGCSRRTSASADHPLTTKVCELGLVEATEFGQHLVCVLAERWRGRQRPQGRSLVAHRTVRQRHRSRRR